MLSPTATLAARLLLQKVFVCVSGIKLHTFLDLSQSLALCPQHLLCVIGLDHPKEEAKVWSAFFAETFISLPIWIMEEFDT